MMTTIVPTQKPAWKISPTSSQEDAVMAKPRMSRTQSVRIDAPAHLTGKRRAVCREGAPILHVRLGIALLLIVGAVAPMRAQDGPVDRGVRTRALAAGWGTAWQFGIPGYDKTRTDAAFVAFHPALGWFVRDRLEVGGEATLFAYYRPKPAVSAGLAGVGARYHLRRAGRLLPFLSGGAGFLWTSLDVPEIDRIFNGQLFYGAGIRVRSDRNPSWRIEIRNHHISNAGTSGENLGLNAFVLIAGVEWFLRSR